MATLWVGARNPPSPTTRRLIQNVRVGRALTLKPFAVNAISTDFLHVFCLPFDLGFEFCRAHHLASLFFQCTGPSGPIPDTVVIDISDLTCNFTCDRMSMSCISMGKV